MTGYLKPQTEDFPGGIDLPANAEDMDSDPGPGRVHMPRSNSARVPQLLSVQSRAPGAQLQSPRAATADAPAPKACVPQ